MGGHGSPPIATARARNSCPAWRITAWRRSPSEASADVSRLPVTVKILLENSVRNAAATWARDGDVEAIAAWNGTVVTMDRERAFMPARVLLQDFTGVPAVVDLAAMRSAVARAGGDPMRIDPLVPVDLVIDHSVQVDAFGNREAYERNIAREYERNRERYSLLRWAQQAFRGFRVVPPGMGIVHQINLEYLAQVVQVRDIDGVRTALPDTLVGTDSHTPMVNGIGVLGWGVGGIEAEACMLGQPLFLLAPVVVGVRFHNALPAGTTATDLVLTLTELLRRHGVVNKFVEFCGSGLSLDVGAGSRHPLQHVAGVRRHRIALSGRRPHARVPPRVGPGPGAHRPRRALREGTGHVPHRRVGDPALQRDGRARPGERGAEPRGSQTPAGPRRAAGCLEVVHQRLGASARAAAT